MARAIDIDITPSAIHSNKAIRGFTNIPGYTFPDENIATEFIPEDYWKTGKSYTGEALRNLPPEEIAKFEQRQRDPTDILRDPTDISSGSIGTSIDDIARMTPGDQGPAIDEMIGPRPSISTLKENLISKAEANFSRHYWKTMNRPPSKDAVEGFYQKVQKDPRILSETKAQLQEYDKNRATLEKQVADTRQRKKVIEGRYKDAVANARKKIDLLDPKERQETMRVFLKELNSAMADPENMESGIVMAIAGIPGVEKDTKGDLTDAAAMKAISDVFSGALGAAKRKAATLKYLELVSGGLSRSKALYQAVGMPPAEEHTGRIIADTDSDKKWKSDGTDWIEVTF